MATTVFPGEGNFQKTARSTNTLLVNLGLISVGSLLFAIGMNTIMVPRNFLCGGLTGIALLLNYRFSFMDIGVVYFVLNIPLILLGWLHISRRFVLYSLFGIFFFSVAASVVKPPAVQVQDPMLAALLAGVICGAGSGLILRSVGSAGGFDILAVYLHKRFGYRMGAVTFGINTAVIIAGVHLHDINVALYSIVLLFTSGRVIDCVVSGFNMRKSVMIVSDRAESIADDIICRLRRGVTILNGEGGYSRQQKKILLTVSPLTDLPKLKELVLHSDPEAFIIVHNTMEVFGKQHSAVKVY
ncbi:MAG: hypothetical protein AMJ54_13325 [Deltaproteobacteria bacterium SG8_13]|nr:MAG: hypothetical protein AMJ54_13325 [Deltaproteobacteria bacterium SG8_13]